MPQHFPPKKGMPRLAFAAALTVVLSLTLLLALLLLLLANLFCSLLRRRSSVRCRDPSPGPPGPADRPLAFPFYAHGVLQAPGAKFLLSVPSLEQAMAAAPRSPSPPPNEFLRISNPVYDDGTPFVTAKASPTDLDEEEAVVVVVVAVEGEGDDCSPPLKLMKKLPPVLPRATSPACLVDGRRRSLATSTETNRPSSSSSSNSLCSTPSWLELTR